MHINSPTKVFQYAAAFQYVICPGRKQNETPLQMCLHEYMKKHMKKKLDPNHVCVLLVRNDEWMH